MPGLGAQRDAPAYQAAKAGLRWLIKHAAMTCAADAVRANAINPKFQQSASAPEHDQP
jgi:NAD(P)-dependent dehydrogenase (short-subunit alcohol dehydrogenase family)